MTAAHGLIRGGWFAATAALGNDVQLLSLLKHLGDQMIFSLVESLTTEIHQFREQFHQFRKETRDGFARIEQVTRRHSTAITAGTFSIGGLTKAVERLETMIHDRDDQIAELRDRVRMLEQKRS